MDKDFKRLEEYFKKAKSNHIAFQGYCHSCKQLTTVTIDLEDDGKLKIEGGAVYFPNIIPIDENQVQDFFIKCDSCFKNDPVLRNYQPALQYSRVVGYLRPVNSYNPGKKMEWKTRKNYQLPEKEILKVA